MDEPEEEAVPSGDQDESEPEEVKIQLNDGDFGKY